MAVDKAFVARLEASKAPGVEKVREEWLPRLREALGGLTDALEGRTAVYAAVATARAASEEEAGEEPPPAGA